MIESDKTSLSFERQKTKVFRDDTVQTLQLPGAALDSIQINRNHTFDPHRAIIDLNNFRNTILALRNSMREIMAKISYADENKGSLVGYVSLEDKLMREFIKRM